MQCTRVQADDAAQQYIYAPFCEQQIIIKHGIFHSVRCFVWTAASDASVRCAESRFELISFVEQSTAHHVI